MLIEQAAAAAGIELEGNAPPAKQRGAQYWRAFIAALRPLIAEQQRQLLRACTDAAQARTEAIELRQQLADRQASPFELLLCRARQGREPLEQMYRYLALQLHPDQGGTCAKFQQLQKDYEQVRWLLHMKEGALSDAMVD